MSSISDVQGGLGNAAQDRAFFGHPKGLSTLFFSEMWERFSYYGLRALLILFMTASVTTGGMGMDVATAGAVYGTYTAMVYLMSVPGGWLADKVLGQRKAVLYGGILIACGHFSLAVPYNGFFPLGLVLIVLGTGLLKPNISVMVGQLYATADERRDAGFSIFYMGINLGGFLGPLVTGYLAQDAGFRATIESWGIDPNNAWHWGFGAAGVGMTLGLIQYVRGGATLGTAGLAAGGATTPELVAKYRRQAFMYGGAAAALVILAALASTTGLLNITAILIRDLAGYSLLVITVVFFGMLFTDKNWTKEERGRLWIIFVFFLAAAIFWSVFDQAGSTLNLFADRNSDNTIFGFAFPSSWYQSLNPLFIIIFAPFFALLWTRLGARQPSSPVQFAIGLVGAGVGFWVMAVAALRSGDGTLVSPMWLAMTLLIHTWAELCLSPVGLSSMTKLAPAKIVGAMMGVWFLGASVGNFFAGQVSAFYESLPLMQLFGVVSLLPFVAGVLMYICAKKMTEMMGGVR
ncbi:MAG: peptide MFS transporter [Rhodospirillaceae bacterium]|nr:peptide MFS transporter [Rhodospirillaceae bacterium]